MDSVNQREWVEMFDFSRRTVLEIVLYRFIFLFHKYSHFEIPNWLSLPSKNPAIHKKAKVQYKFNFKAT